MTIDYYIIVDKYVTLDLCNDTVNVITGMLHMRVS